MIKYRALDLFCGAGGASMGLHRAGFDVTGVDIKPQPRYPFRFVQGDALNPPFDLTQFDFIWASPPCQAFTQMSNRWRGKNTVADTHCDLIGPTRHIVFSSDRPFVLENVRGSIPSLRHSIILTGEMFGLAVHRPRYFECNYVLLVNDHPSIQSSPVSVYGAMDGRRLWTRRDGSILRAPKSLDIARAAMAIDWMIWDELCQAIPPAYSEFIGRQIIAILDNQRATA